MSQPCVCIGGGSGCNPLSGKATVQDYLSAFGYLYNSNDPLAGIYASIIAQNTPTSLQKGEFSAGYKQFAEACLRSRTLLYCNKTPGDGTTPAGISSSTAAIRVDSSLALTGVGIAGQIGSKLGLLATGVTTALGFATAGAGIALGVILQIFQNHAAAVSRQANALGTLCPEASSVIQSIDAAVAKGQVSTSDAMAAMQQLKSAFVQNTTSLTKDCNAFCAYISILGAQMQLSPYKWGVSVAPSIVTPSSTARIVTSIGTNVQGTIHPTSAISSPTEEDNIAPQATAAQSVAAQAGVVTGLSPLVLLAIAGILLVIFLRK